MANKRQIALTAQGMRNLVIRRSKEDFIFAVGDTTYGCPSFVAEFLSGRVTEQLLADATMRELQISAMDADKIFTKVLLLGSGCSVEVEEWEKPLFIGVCGELRNRELFELIFGRLDSEPTIDTVFDRLSLFTAQQSDISREISFIASHFHEFPSSRLFSLDLPTLHEILYHPSLRLESDDRLCIDLLKQTEFDCDYFSLFGFVRFEFVSPSVISAFIDRLNGSFEYFDFSIWSALQNRLIPSTHPTTRDLLMHPVVCPFVSRLPFDGIIAYLTNKCGGNVHDHEVVLVTSNRTRKDQHKAENVVELDSNNGFWSDDLPGQFLCYDFVKCKVSVTHYSIRSHSPANEAHPRNWVVEGSDDGLRWTMLDSRRDDTHLNGGNKVWTYSVDQSTPFEMIRIRSTGVSQMRQIKCLGFVAFELFGTLLAGKG
jgi:hypothetical protein